VTCRPIYGATRHDDKNAGALAGVNVGFLIGIAGTSA
jgi:hypothetical protein